IGEIHLFEKEYQKALESYLKGLSIDQSQGDTFRLAGDYNMLGELYLEMDRVQEAEGFFQQALEVSREIDLKPEIASAYYNLGKVYNKRGGKNRYKEYMRQAQEIYALIDPARYQEIKEEFIQSSGPLP
ncbi:MAG: tetratricopeptide repeat protein, partial [Candidatus Omnitrophica bacterium]|nr:tetratricopeptide repeat protein [Candidatus Omnitrophota bacterium]